MSTDDPLLDRTLIEDAFRRLGDRLARRGVIGDLYIFGGAAMALAYDARRATRDIDAVLRPHGVVLDEAKIVAEELGLPPWWLNEQGSVYVALITCSCPQLTPCSRSAPRYLLTKRCRIVRDSYWEMFSRKTESGFGRPDRRKVARRGRRTGTIA